MTTVASLRPLPQPHLGGLCTPTGCGTRGRLRRLSQNAPVHRSHKPLENRHTTAGFPQRAQATALGSVSFKEERQNKPTP
jgi:hypothetical protein